MTNSDTHQTPTIPHLTTNILIGLKLIGLFAILFYQYPVYLLLIFIFLLCLSISGELLSSYFNQRGKTNLVTAIYTALVLIDALTFAAVLIIFRLFASDFYLLGLVSLIVIPFRGGLWVGFMSGSLVSFFYFVLASGELTQSALLLRTASLLSVCLVSGYWGEILQKEIKAKEVLAKKVDALKEAAKLRNEYISVAVHNFRTPLTALKGYWEALGEEDLESEERRKFLDQMKDVLANLEKLVNELLEVSKIQAKKTEISRRWVNPLPLIKEVFNSLKPAALGKGLDFEFQDDLKMSVWVLVDVRTFKNILANLLDNAVKYTQKGEVLLRCWCEDNNFLISVRDTGPGIAKKEQGKIFKPFYRGKSKAAEMSKGTGLGLYIVKRFVGLNGGTVDLASDSGQGCTFTLSFPMKAREGFMRSF